MSKLPPYTPEEWEHKKASLLEDVRILRAMNQEMQENADMLRERGHEAAALHMETGIVEAEAIADKIETALEEASQ